MTDPRLAQSLWRLRDLQRAGRHDAALRDAGALLRAHPGNCEIALIRIIALRNLGRIADALLAIDRLEKSEPRFSRLFQERGLCHLALGEDGAAIAAFEQAVRLNPALPASWSLLEGLYRRAGNPRQAENAAAHVGLLKRQPMEIVAATSLLADNDIDDAEKLITAFIARHGRHPEALRLLARIVRDDIREAELLLAEVLTCAPHYASARFEYAEALAHRRKYLQAREQVAHLVELDPQNATYRTLEATVAVGLGDFETAIALYKDLLVREPSSPDLHLWLGHALKSAGRVPDAIESYRAAIASRPTFGEAWWSLANLKTYRFDDDALAQMRHLDTAPNADPADRIAMSFALGKALEDRGDIEASWTAYAHGNAMKRHQSPYRATAIEANVEHQREVCTREFFEARAGWGLPTASPIFIVGLPRSGSTLLEQILASHSQVEATDELADIPRLVRELQGHRPDAAKPRYPAAMSDLTQPRVAEMAADYLAATDVYRTGKAFFIDKMPNNFRHLGLIHLMFPNAKIIDARREPMACCFSNLKQLYAEGQEFSYGMADVAHYYRAYLELMRHWDAVLPGRILCVHYEDVVTDLEASVRRMLHYCGLDFEPACLTYYNSGRTARTPSSEQVRQSIFHSGLDDWKRYERWLGLLKCELDLA
jgi:tetratricopeptide (TPR) repeat protein